MIPFAYVTGTFYTAAGTARANERITFQPMSTPYVVDGEVVLSVPLTITLDSQGRIHDGNGNLRYKLAKGFYRVTASDTDSFNIEVPDDQADHEVASLTSDVSPSPVIGVQQILTPNDVFNTVEDSDATEWSNSGPSHEASEKIVFLGELGDVSDEDYFYRWSEESKVHPQFILGNANPGGASDTFETSLFQWGNYLTTPSTFLRYAFGTEDYSNPAGLTAILQDYAAIIPGRYYKVSVESPHATVDVFVMDSNDNCPDGNTSNSVQALWLRDQLALSTARWKIVCFSAPPVCSVAGKANVAMNWPFTAWGVDLVVAGGAKVTEFRVLSDGTPLAIAGTSGKGPYDTMDGDSNYSFADNTIRQAVVVDITAAKLTVLFVQVPKGSRWMSQTILGKPDHRITVAPKFQWDSGFTVHSPLGEGLRPEPWGMANFNHSVGRLANYVITQNYGALVRLDSVPTADMARSNPLLKHCMVIVTNGSSVELHVWVPAYGGFRALLAEVVDFGGASVATEQLVPPTISNDGSNSVLGVEISHETSGVDIWVSVNFEAFYRLTSWPALVLFESPKTDSPSVVSAFASKAGFIDSEIISLVSSQAIPELVVGSPF